MRDVIIIGSGPAGYAAAVYAARAELSPLLLASSVDAGGELMQTTTVENFPGFPDGIDGPDLMDLLRRQAERFGTEVVLDDAVALTPIDGGFEVAIGSGRVERSRTVIFAAGSAPRKLGVPGESELGGHGVSYCATCDGFFFRERTIAVVGGGDSACEEALFLTRFADRVHLIHRRGELRASQIMQRRVHEHPKIQTVWNAQVVSVNGTDGVSSVTLRSTLDATESELELEGLFVAVGNDPRTHLVHGLVELTEQGYIAVEAPSTRTAVPGLFAAGDVTDPTYQQAVTAAASGAKAAMDAEAYLAALEAAPSSADTPIHA